MHPTITIRNARLHNLKNVTLEIPKNKLVVLTGLSGSGKSTLAFDILHKESLRQFMESLGMVTWGLSKPPVDAIVGLSPSISVDQHLTNHSPRSTVGTDTEVFTYLRVLYARLGHRPCPECGKDVPPPTYESSDDRLAGRIRRKPRWDVSLPALRRGGARDGHGQLLVQQACGRLPHLHGAGRGAAGHRQPPD